MSKFNVDDLVWVDLGTVSQGIVDAVLGHGKYIVCVDFWNRYSTRYRVREVYLDARDTGPTKENRLH